MNIESPNHSQTTPRILLVSDDVQLRLLLSELLVVDGYDVVSTNGVGVADWDAAIVDAAAAGAGRHLRALEARARAPVIAVATASNPAARPLWDRVDAVVHEPLGARKLLLIMRGLLAGRGRAPSGGDRSLTKGPVTLHPLLNGATVAARHVSLTEVETRVLRELMLAASAPVSRDRLTLRGLGRGWLPDDRCLDTHIKRLRRKLGSDQSGRTPIRTVRGVGYLLLEQWQPAI